MQNLILKACEYYQIHCIFLFQYQYSKYSRIKNKLQILKNKTLRNS